MGRRKMGREPCGAPTSRTAYFKKAGFATLRCKMLLMCFSKESGLSARMRRGDSAAASSSRVQSRGGDAGWTVLLQDTRDSAPSSVGASVQAPLGCLRGAGKTRPASKRVSRDRTRTQRSALLATPGEPPPAPLSPHSHGTHAGQASERTGVGTTQPSVTQTDRASLAGIPDPPQPG